MVHSLHKSAGLEPYQHARAARIVSIAGLRDARVSVKVTEKWTKDEQDGRSIPKSV